MKSKLFGLVFLLFLAAIVAGCSSAKPTAGVSGVPESAQMQPSQTNPQLMSYRNPGVDIAQYKKVILMPVEIYAGPDAEFKDVSPEDQQKMANHLYEQTTKVLQEKDLLAMQPGPGVARLKLILGGLVKTRPVAAGATHLLPLGLAVNLGKGAMGKEGRFMGSATVGGEFTDSTTNALIASFLVREAPNAMYLPGAFTTWEASEKALDQVAEQIGNRIAQNTQLSQK